MRKMSPRDAPLQRNIAMVRLREASDDKVSNT